MEVRAQAFVLAHWPLKTLSQAICSNNDASIIKSIRIRRDIFPGFKDCNKADLWYKRKVYEVDLITNDYIGAIDRYKQSSSITGSPELVQKCREQLTTIYARLTNTEVGLWCVPFVTGKRNSSATTSILRPSGKVGIT